MREKKYLFNLFILDKWKNFILGKIDKLYFPHQIHYHRMSVNQIDGIKGEGVGGGVGWEL